FNLGLIHQAYGWGVTSTPGCVDFTTGGGWVKPPPNKGTFGFVAGYKNGGTNPRGNLEYHDHTSAINVHSQDVLYYNCGNYDNSEYLVATHWSTTPLDTVIRSMCKTTENQVR